MKNTVSSILLPLVTAAMVSALIALWIVNHHTSKHSNNKSAVVVPDVETLVPSIGADTKIMNTPLGAFYFVMKGKEKADNGWKVGFVIGNRNFADYENLKLRISFGKKPKDKEKAKLAATDITIKKVKAGSWKNILVIIPVKDENDFEIINFGILGAEKIYLKAEPK